MATVIANTSLDADAHGIPDYYERLHGLDKDNPHDATLDPDNDSLDNLTEFQLQSLAQSRDSDLDGMYDGWEVAQGLDLTQPDAEGDIDADGISNYDEFIAFVNGDSGSSAPDGNLRKNFGQSAA